MAWMARWIGDVAHNFAPARRAMALHNLRAIYGDQKTEKEIRAIVRGSFGSFLLSLFESVWFPALLEKPEGIEHARKSIAGLDSVLERARSIHDKTGGCIFVTPHFGNYGALPGLCSAAGIPLVVPVHELRNPYIQRRWWPLNDEGRPGAAIFVPRKNSLNSLRKALREGRSVGIVPDQRTIRGLSVEFLGRNALTTPVPALLSLAYERPILVCACRRSEGGYSYEITLSEPLWPKPSRQKRSEILRLTLELNQMMGEVIHRHPEQYLWMHDRWRPSTPKTRL